MLLCVQPRPHWTHEYCIPAAHAEVAGNPPKLLEEGESKQQDEGTDSEPLLGIRRIHGMAGQLQVLNSIPEELESDPDAECIHQSKTIRRRRQSK